jgi:DNA-binding Lrp family transcriptional regulator
LRLTKLQKQLCNLLQQGLLICPRPFGEIAKLLNIDEGTVLQEVKRLKTIGVIQRIGAIINYRTLGMVSTLVAAHVPEPNLQEVVNVVNSLDNVSHNYLREHYYNLWFTLLADSAEQIDIVLSELSARFNVNFHSLPTERVFKLDARFDTEENGRLFNRVAKPPVRKNLRLNEQQKLIISKLQTELEPVARPFDFLCNQGPDGVKIENVLSIVTELIDKGLLRRIAAVLDHRKLGFTANVLFAGEVSRERIVHAAEALIQTPVVSHCCQRKTFEDWPYNLFAMMHGKSMADIQCVINKFVEAEKIDSFQLLPTAAELKKQPVKCRSF